MFTSYMHSIESDMVLVCDYIMLTSDLVITILSTFWDRLFFSSALFNSLQKNDGGLMVQATTNKQWSFRFTKYNL